MKNLVGNHQKEIENFFAGNVAYGGESPEFEFPLILMGFTNRCGSNLLAERLRLTGTFGGLYEHLNADAVANMAKETGAQSFPEHLSNIIPRHKGAAPVFGFKSSWDQLLMILRWRIDKMFSGLRIINIQRLDVLGQAVSYSIADQTKKWTSNQQGNGKTPVYDAYDIQNRLNGISNGNGMLRQICSVLDLDSYNLTYEDFLDSPIIELDKIHKWLGMPLRKIDVGARGLQKQSNNLNQQFVQRFRDEARL